MKKRNIKFVAKVLTDAGAECEVDIQNGIVLAKNLAGSIDSYVFSIDDDGMMCVVVWKDRVVKKALPKVLDLIDRINETTAAEHFAVHPETGDIISTVTRRLSNGELKEEAVLEILTRSKKLKAGYEKAFQSVTTGKETPKKAMQNAQKQYLASLSISELVDDLAYLSDDSLSI